MQRRKFITKSSFVIFGWSFYENSIMRSLDSNRSIKEIKQLSVIAPSTIRPNEEFSLHLKFIKDPYFTEWRVVDNFNKSPRGTTFMKNTVDNWSGALEIIADLDLKGRSKYSIGDGENWSNGMGELKGFSFRNPGIKEIQVRDVNNDIVGVSNPILVSDNPINLYWGDLHCHSFFGDGIRSPEELHLFARDEAQFDVFALTEHTDLLTDDQWKYFVNVANRFNQPGKFVSFVGGEWTSSKYGHRGFIYQDIGPIIRTNHPNQNDLQKLFSIVSANNGLVIANHPNWSSYAVKFNEYVDQWSVERLVEIFSTGGIYENSKDQDNGKGDSVIDGLKGGAKTWPNWDWRYTRWKAR